jgi:hypothetical protein
MKFQTISSKKNGKNDQQNEREMYKHLNELKEDTNNS